MHPWMREERAQSDKEVAMISRISRPNLSVHGLRVRHIYHGSVAAPISPMMATCTMSICSKVETSRGGELKAGHDIAGRLACEVQGQLLKCRLIMEEALLRRQEGSAAWAELSIYGSREPNAALSDCLGGPRRAGRRQDTFHASSTDPSERGRARGPLRFGSSHVITASCCTAT